MSFSPSSSFLRRGPDDGSEDANAAFAFLHHASKLVPRIEASNAGCIRLLPRDLKYVAETEVMKPAYCGEVVGEASECPRFNCSIRACTFSAITSFAVCFCCLLVFAVWLTAAMVLIMGASSLGLLHLAFCP